jgi:hypothetical protein
MRKGKRPPKAKKGKNAQSPAADIALDDKARRKKIRQEAEAKMAEFGDDENAKMTRQGDLAFYSDSKQRQREALRWYPDVLTEMGRWWDATLKADDANEDCRVQKREYASFYARIFAAFNPDGMSPEEIYASFTDDWSRDSQSFSYLSQKRYEDAIFMLADMWCETSEEIEYLDFLTDLYPKVFPDLLIPAADEGEVDDDDDEGEESKGDDGGIDGSVGADDSAGDVATEEDEEVPVIDRGEGGKGAGDDDDDDDDDDDEEEDEFGLTQKERKDLAKRYQEVKAIILAALEVDTAAAAAAAADPLADFRDEMPPKFVRGFPKCRAFVDPDDESGEHVIEVVVQLQDIGNCHYVLLPADSAAPTADEVRGVIIRNGNIVSHLQEPQTGGAVPVARGFLPLDLWPGRMERVFIRGDMLEPDTAYDLYCVAEDLEPPPLTRIQPVPTRTRVVTKPTPAGKEGGDAEKDEEGAEGDKSKEQNSRSRDAIQAEKEAAESSHIFMSLSSDWVDVDLGGGDDDDDDDDYDEDEDDEPPPAFPPGYPFTSKVQQKEFDLNVRWRQSAASAHYVVFKTSKAPTTNSEEAEAALASKLAAEFTAGDIKGAALHGALVQPPDGNTAGDESVDDDEGPDFTSKVVQHCEGLEADTDYQAFVLVQFDASADDEDDDEEDEGDDDDAAAKAAAKAKAFAPQLHCLHVRTKPMDTAPRFADGYPTVRGVQTEQCDLLVKMEAGRPANVFYLILPAHDADEGEDEGGGSGAAAESDGGSDSSVGGDPVSLEEVKHAGNSRLAWAGCIAVDAADEDEDEDEDHDNENEGGEGEGSEGGPTATKLSRIGRVHRAVLKRGLEAGKRYHIWMVSESVEEEHHQQEGGEKHTPCLGQLTKLVVQMKEEAEESDNDKGEESAPDKAADGARAEDASTEEHAASIKRYGNDSEGAAESSPFSPGLVYPTIIPTSVGFDLVSVLGDAVETADPAEVFYVIRTAATVAESAVADGARPSAAEVVGGVDAVSDAVGGGCCMIRARNWSRGGAELDTTAIHPACHNVWDIDGLEAGLSYVIYVAVKTSPADGTGVVASEVSEISITVDWDLDEGARKVLLEEKRRREAAAEAARKKREEEEAARKLDEEAARKAQEEEDARKAAEEAARKEAEEAARKEAEEQAKRDAEEAARKAAEEERKRALEAAEAARKKAKEERRLALEAAEVARKKAEEERRLALEAAEAARKAAEEKAAAEKSAEAEEAARKAAEEADRARKEAEEAARKEAEEAERARKEAEEAARKEAEEAERVRKEHEEELRKEEEARKAAEEAARKAAEERARREAEAEAARRAAEEAAKKAAEEREAAEAAAAARAKKKAGREAKRRSKKDKKAAAAAAKKEALEKYLAEKAAKEVAELEARAEARRLAAEARKKAAAEAAVRIAARQAEAEARAEEMRNKANHVGVKGLMEMRVSALLRPRVLLFRGRCTCFHICYTTTLAPWMFARTPQRACTGAYPCTHFLVIPRLMFGYFIIEGGDGNWEGHDAVRGRRRTAADCRHRTMG